MLAVLVWVLFFLMAQWVKGRLTGLPFCYINKRNFLPEILHLSIVCGKTIRDYFLSNHAP